ncbi:MAG: hypothetical protein WCD45_03925 [Gallionella sp.]
MSTKTSRQYGGTLIELIMFIVIVSVAIVGIMLVMNQISKNSADPLIRKQAIAVAYSLLGEIELQDFISSTGTSVAVTQSNRASAYHIVSDYNGFSTTGIYPVSGASVTSGLASYNASVAIVPTALGAIAAGSAVQINVTVTAPDGKTVTATGYRTAY